MKIKIKQGWPPVILSWHLPQTLATFYQSASQWSCCSGMRSGWSRTKGSLFGETVWKELFVNVFIYLLLIFLYFTPFFFLVDIDAKTINSQNQTWAFLVCDVIIWDPIRLQVLGNLVHRTMNEVMLLSKYTITCCAFYMLSTQCMAVSCGFLRDHRTMCQSSHIVTLRYSIMASALDMPWCLAWNLEIFSSHSSLDSLCSLTTTGGRRLSELR